MIISAICVTYGRTRFAASALKCFLEQDYPDKRLILLNTCSEQTLRFSYPTVDVLNLKVRPQSLGHARNIVIGAAPNGPLVCWDDDDGYLPNHLSTFAKHFTDGIEWVWLDKEFYAEGIKIKSVVAGQLPLFAFTKRAWKEVGMYNNLTVGEDRDLVGKITARFNGKKIPLAKDEITYIYRWANGAYHVSGSGMDKAGQTTAHDRIAKDLERRMRIGAEPKGMILLKPAYYDINPTEMARYFLDNYKTEIKKNSVAIVELGRIGDIINCLPICHHVAETHSKPYLVVSKEFTPLLEGISYVEPYPLDLRHDQLNEALAIARRDFKHVIQCQIWGRNYAQDKQCTSYNEESWRMAGFRHKFYDRTWRPVFDQRNPDREAALVKKTRLTTKPMLIVNVTRSISSPLPQGKELLEKVKARWGNELEIVDVSDWQLPHFYDMLGLIEESIGVLSIDTSLIHLASVTNRWIIALVNSLPWLGTKVRSENAVTLDYDRAVSNPGWIDTQIWKATWSKRNQPFCWPLLKQPLQRNIYHAVERHSDHLTPDRTRIMHAQKSWDAIYKQDVIPCHYWNYARNAKQIGDHRELPYLKDVLKFAMDQAKDEDVIFFTNDDNALHPNLPEILTFHCSLWGACTAQRCEYFGQSIPESLSPSEHARRTMSFLHIGRDLFAATKCWLAEKWDSIPDFILGASDWDLCLALLVRLELGIQPDRKTLIQEIFPAEIPRGYVIHQNHHSAWMRPDNVNTAPSQLWNRRLFYEWSQSHAPNLKFNKHMCI